ncbi:MAG: DEAD/DEAH box helicase [Proteobacteria bacterium]|jgi:ATP-dependent RNA helicase RhlE|nr:DEAD/DEAH box helicase [Pseudomonadota bacterium]
MQISSFAELGLRPEILRAVTEAGYTTPTPIQAQAIPEVLAGHDIMGGAQTGTGKTAGFGLPILQRLLPHANTSPSPARHLVRALVLAPTRELAIQVEESIRGYGKYTGLRSTCVYGGVDIRQQLPIVRGGVEILVATPGRLLDHLEQKSINLGHVETFVLDEADRMLDMGFIPDIKRIMAVLPAKRQNLLFSATFSNDIKRLADDLLNAPKLIEVARRNTAAETVSQSVYKLPQEAKRALLVHIVSSRNLWQVLCFVRTKHGASRLARQLERDGLAASAIHGDKTQAARLEALAKFKEGKLQVLVATDVAARGLDIDGLPLVVNFELPHVPEDYIHRIGRTGRAGASGEATSFVAHEEERYLVEIEKMLKKKIAMGDLDGFDAGAAAAASRERAPRGEAHQAPRGAAHRAAQVTSRGSAQAAPRGASQAASRGPRRPAQGSAQEPAPRDPRAPAPPRDRRAEREAAYAKNPDQPIVRRDSQASAGNGGSASGAHAPRAHAHMHAARRSRPVPALLQKRAPPGIAKA